MTAFVSVLEREIEGHLRRCGKFGMIAQIFSCAVFWNTYDVL